jgi:hypothetical protein
VDQYHAALFETYRAESERLHQAAPPAPVFSSLAFGSPDDILAKIEWRQAVLGYETKAMFWPVFRGLPITEARRSMPNLSKQVLPTLQATP